MLMNAKTRTKGIMFIQPRTFNFLQRSSRTFDSFGKWRFASIWTAQSCVPSITSQKRFTTAEIGNIVHNPSSTSAEGLFHGTGISLFQHINVSLRKKQVQFNPRKAFSRPVKSSVHLQAFMTVQLRLVYTTE